MYEAKEHEKLFHVRPIGVRYICESCNDGEMKVDSSVTFAPIPTTTPMYPHKCTKCGCKMMLPKMYPYIEWQEVTQESTIEEVAEVLNYMINSHYETAPEMAAVINSLRGEEQ